MCEKIEKQPKKDKRVGRYKPGTLKIIEKAFQFQAEIETLGKKR